MRFIFRFASFVVLVMGILVASVDAIQSVSASQPVLTPLATALMAGGASVQATVEGLERATAGGGIAAIVVRWVLQQPAFAAFFCCALLLWVIGYRRQPAAGRFAA